MTKAASVNTYKHQYYVYEHVCTHYIIIAFIIQHSIRLHY